MTTYDDFMQIANTYSESIVEKTIPTRFGDKRFVSFILRDDLPPDDTQVHQIRNDTLGASFALFIDQEQYSKKDDFRMMFFYLEPGFGSASISEHDCYVQVGDVLSLRETDHKKGFVGFTFGYEDIGCAINAFGYRQLGNETDDDVEIRIIHNSKLLKQSMKN